MRAIDWRTVGVAAAFLGCEVSGLSRNEYRRIDEWLGCQECWNAERVAVRAIGQRAVPKLTQFLREGPDSGRRQVMRTQFAAGYTQRPGVTLTRDQYADRLLSNYVANHQIRSAISLADIGGDKARAALDDALADTATLGYRPDVVAAIQAARARIGTNAFSGTVATPVVAFGDRAIITSAPGQPFTSDTRAILDENVFPADSVLLFNQPDSLGFIAVGSARSHAVSITNVGTAGNTELASLSINTLHDRNDRATVRCGASRDCQADSAQLVTVTPAMPFLSFFALWRGGPASDTIDLFRFQPSVSTPVTARLDWRPLLSPPSGPSNIEFGFRPCSQFAFSGAGSFAPVPNPSPPISETISAGQCRLLIVKLRPGGARSVFARLRVTSP
jgi:hypothetical protein